MHNFALKVYEFFNGCVNEPGPALRAAKEIGLARGVAAEIDSDVVRSAVGRYGVSDYKIVNSLGENLVQIKFDHRAKKVVCLFVEP